MECGGLHSVRLECRKKKKEKKPTRVKYSCNVHVSERVAPFVPKRTELLVDRNPFATTRTNNNNKTVSLAGGNVTFYLYTLPEVACRVGNEIAAEGAGGQRVFREDVAREGGRQTRKIKTHSRAPVSKCLLISNTPVPRPLYSSTIGLGGEGEGRKAAEYARDKTGTQIIRRAPFGLWTVV